MFKTLSFKSNLPFAQKIVSLANSLIMLLRYGFSLVRMERFVEVLSLSFLFFFSFLLFYFMWALAVDCDLSGAECCE